MKVLPIIIFLAVALSAGAQVAINNDGSMPDNSAVLDLKSSNKGVLFPRLTRLQRDAITNPANGLHIFNTTSSTLEYYDSVFNVWTVYCPECGYFTDTLKSTGPDTTYLGYQLSPAAGSYKKVLLVINANVKVLGAPFTLSNASAGSNIIIKNHGMIIAWGGRGGIGGETADGVNCSADPAQSGYPGDNAILSKPGTTLTVYNYGTIGGGGGGGGGGGAGTYPGGNTGGGGGSGAGYHGGAPDYGYKGYQVDYIALYQICSNNPNVLAQDGQEGTLFAGGAGGAGGQSGSPLFAGYAGGSGGGLGQPGQNGLDSWQNPGGLGGPPGKAISGNAGNNTVINSGSGVVYGAID